MKTIYLFSLFIAVAVGTAFGQAPKGPDTDETVGGTSSASTVKIDRQVSPPSASDTAEPPAKPAARSAGDSDVHSEITPYGWLSGIQGNLRVRNTPVRVDSNGSDVLKAVDFAIGIRAEVSKGRWGLHIDEDYANLGTSGRLNGPLATPYDVQPTLNIFEVGPQYTLYFKPNSDNSLPDVFSVEALGGLRWFHLGLGLKAGNNIDLEGSRNIVDVYGGARLKYRPDPKWTLSTKVTLGGGGSSSAWTVNGLIDWRFYKNVSVMGGYQVLDMNADDVNNTVGFDGRLKGLIFGMTFYH
jgi:hypothetical protein